MSDLELQKIKESNLFQKKIEKKLNSILWELNCRCEINETCIDYLLSIQSLLNKHDALD